MQTPASYEHLIQHVREISLLGSTAAILSWDQETMLPSGAIEHRAQQMAQLAKLRHERITDPAFADLLLACEDLTQLSARPQSDTAITLQEIRRDFDKANKLPPELVAEISQTESLAQHHWAQARKDSDYSAFQPWLAKILHLMQQKVACLGIPEGAEAWDVLADDFEPEVRASELTELFRPLREELTQLLREIQEKGQPVDDSFLRAEFAEERQEVITAMGFDFARGRLDRSTHPFCSGNHPTDVRLTTRFHKDNFLDALGSTMHEAGHGLYEQGLPMEHAGTPLAEAVSMGIHESQSRLWENQVGRSQAFWRWCQPKMQQILGSQSSAEELYRAANLVRPSFIRVEADEVTYNLHVLVRFELELDLFRGNLDLADLPAAWNQKYQDYLGIQVTDDAQGCLQDVHWSCGLFGYFPTYTLGNLYSAQFFAAAQKALPDLDGQLARGEFDPLRQWLAQNIHCHGKRYSAARLCKKVTGQPLGQAAFMDYLKGKLRPLYLGLR